MGDWADSVTLGTEFHKDIFPTNIHHLPSSQLSTARCATNRICPRCPSSWSRSICRIQNFLSIHSPKSPLYLRIESGIDVNGRGGSRSPEGVAVRWGGIGMHIDTAYRIHTPSEAYKMLESSFRVRLNLAICV